MAAFRWSAASLTLSVVGVEVGLILFAQVGSLPPGDIEPGLSPREVADGTALVALASCTALMGLCYRLGRTRPPPEAKQGLKSWARVVTAIPFAGLVLLPMINGLYSVTRHRLLVRQFALIAGLVLAIASVEELDFGDPGWIVAATLQMLVLLLAITTTRRLPTSQESPAEPPVVSSATTWTRSNTPPRPSPTPTDGAAAGLSLSRYGPPAVSTVTGVLAGSAPAGEDSVSEADGSRLVEPQSPCRWVDVSSVADCLRRHYWLAASMKFGAIFFALGLLAPDGPLAFGWGKAIVASVGGMIAVGIAVLFQEGRLASLAAVAVTVLTLAVLCLAGVAWGLMTGHTAETALAGWLTLPVIFLIVYRRRLSACGLTHQRISSASHPGVFPARAGEPGGHRAREWMRRTLAAVVALPVMIVQVINNYLSIPVLSDGIGLALDALYPKLRRLPATVVREDAGPLPRIGFAESAQPEAWSLRVRGDVLRWGRIGPHHVPFAEFLHAFLRPAGETQPGGEHPADPSAAPHPPNITLVTVGVPYRADILDVVASMAVTAPLILLVEPVGRTPVMDWGPPGRALALRGIALPAIRQPRRTLGALRLPGGDTNVYLAERRTQWSYLAVLDEALGPTTL